MTDTPRDVRRIVYTGRVPGAGGKTLHGWRNVETGDEYAFAKLPGGAIGGIYTAEFNETSVYPATLTFTGDSWDDDDERALWEAADAQVRRAKARLTAERALARNSSMERALEPLVRLASKARTRNDLYALQTLVSERLAEAYWKKG